MAYATRIVKNEQHRWAQQSDWKRQDDIENVLAVCVRICWICFWALFLGGVLVPPSRHRHIFVYIKYSFHCLAEWTLDCTHAYRHISDPPPIHSHPLSIDTLCLHVRCGLEIEAYIFCGWNVFIGFIGDLSLMNAHRSSCICVFAHWTNDCRCHTLISNIHTRERAKKRQTKPNALTSHMYTSSTEYVIRNASTADGCAFLLNFKAHVFSVLRLFCYSLTFSPQLAWFFVCSSHCTVNRPHIYRLIGI